MSWIGGDQALNEEQMQNNATLVYAHLQASGYAPETIYAILGNLENESTINPERNEVGGGGGYGLVGWTPKSNLIDACATLGLSPYTDGDNQLDVINSQLLGLSGLNTWYTTEAFISPYYNSGATRDMIGVTGEEFKVNAMGWSADKLAVMFMVGFERPSYDPGTNHYDRRMEDALKWQAWGGGSA